GCWWRERGPGRAAPPRRAPPGRRPRRRGSAGPLVDDVPTVHPHGEVGEDVAVVEPAAGGVLDEFDPDGVRRAEGFGLGDRARGFFPAMAVQVEGVEEVVEAVDVEADPLADLG